jgi:hypothetical protein
MLSATGGQGVRHDRRVGQTIAVVSTLIKLITDEELDYDPGPLDVKGNTSEMSCRSFVGGPSRP